MSNLFPLVNLCYRNWFICVDSLIHRRKKRSLSFSLLFALESKKTLMSSTISLRYFLHCVFWHECVDCCSDWIWFRLWILKVITTPTFLSQRLPKTLRRSPVLFLMRLWRRAPVLRWLPLHRCLLPVLTLPAHPRKPQALSLYSFTWWKVRWFIMKKTNTRQIGCVTKPNAWLGRGTPKADSHQVLKLI